jgi:enediyne biosynthesis protein E4
VLLLSVASPPVLLRNDGGNKNHWLGVTLFGPPKNRDGIGARVTVVAGGHRREKRVLGGTSYCSVSDPRLVFGLGPSTTAVERLEVRWPDGRVQALATQAADRYVTVRYAPGGTP